MWGDVQVLGQVFVLESKVDRRIAVWTDEMMQTWEFIVAQCEGDTQHGPTMGLRNFLVPQTKSQSNSRDVNHSQLTDKVAW